MKKEIEIEFTQEMADDLNKISKELGLPANFKPERLRCLFG